MKKRKIIRVTMEVDVTDTIYDQSVSDDMYAIMELSRFLQKAQTSNHLYFMGSIKDFHNDRITKAMHDANKKNHHIEDKMIEHMMKTLKITK